MLLYDRNLSVKVEEIDCNSLKATAILLNNVYSNSYNESFNIVVLVEKGSMRIVDIVDVAIEGYSFICQGLISRVQNIKGLTITSGYNKKVSEIIGGESGCTHMVELLIEVGRCIVLAYYNNFCKEQLGVNGSIEDYISKGGVKCLGLGYEVEKK